MSNSGYLCRRAELLLPEKESKEISVVLYMLCVLMLEIVLDIRTNTQLSSSKFKFPDHKSYTQINESEKI